jgi:hypothetical protein
LFFYFVFFRVRADSRGEGGREGEGGGEGREGEGREGRCVHLDAHVRADTLVSTRTRDYKCVRADALSCPCRRARVRADVSASARACLVLPQVTSKRTLQCVQVMDAPAAIVRSSVRPFIRKRPRDNHREDEVVK